VIDIKVLLPRDVPIVTQGYLESKEIHMCDWDFMLVVSPSSCVAYCMEKESWEPTGLLAGVVTGDPNMRWSGHVFVPGGLLEGLLQDGVYGIGVRYH
jgi:hypothetical protein